MNLTWTRPATNDQLETSYHCTFALFFTNSLLLVYSSLSNNQMEFQFWTFYIYSNSNFETLKQPIKKLENQFNCLSLPWSLGESIGGGTELLRWDWERVSVLTLDSVVAHAREKREELLCVDRFSVDCGGGLRRGWEAARRWGVMVG